MCLVALSSSEDLVKYLYKSIVVSEPTPRHLEELCCPQYGLLFLTREHTDVEEAGLDQVDAGQMYVP